MRTYVSTIGHHSTRVMRPILNNGIEATDTVVLLRPRDDTSEQGSDAVQDIRQAVHEFGPNTEVIVENITYGTFETAVLECIDILEAADGTLIVNFDGGPREVFLPFAVAALSRSNLVDKAVQFRDIDKKVHDISLPNVVDRIPPATDDTLQVIADLDGETTLPEIADRTEKARSTVGRHGSVQIS